MSEFTGRIVRSVAGHDKGELFCIVGMQNGHYLLANGKQRKLAAPKRKKPIHVVGLQPVAFDHPAIEKLKQGEPVSDRELRRALAAFKEGMKLG